MRPQLASAHATHVLTRGLAMTGRPQAIYLWLGNAAVHLGLRLNRRGRLDTLPPAPRDDDAVRVGRDRVEELDLDADDRIQAGLVSGRGEPDGSVEALVV